jgi:uncharacterized protein (UPF0332 family)
MIDKETKISSDIEAKTHEGVRRMLGFHFTKTGKLSIEWNKFYSDLFASRQSSDYGDFIYFTREIVEDTYMQAISFIEIIKQLIV